MRQHGQATQVLSGCREREFIVRTTESAQPQAGDFQNPLRVGEEHLDLLAQATRPRVFRRLPNPSRDITSMLVMSRAIFRIGVIRANGGMLTAA